MHRKTTELEIFQCGVDEYQNFWNIMQCW